MTLRMVLAAAMVAAAACSAPAPDRAPAPETTESHVADAPAAPASAPVPVEPEQVVDPAAGQGTIVGHVRLAGRPPGNKVIRMGLDPGCVAATAGQLVVQEAVMTGEEGGLANVFVRLVGTFPDTPVPDEPVVLAQQGCVYRPRVIGVRAGQVLEIRNDDDLLHNVHSYGNGTNGFNVAQPTAGMVHRVTLQTDSRMIPFKCDLHRWMIAYVGVVTHPYFAVTDDSGSFSIEHVPAGTRTIRIWHERYGTQEQTVEVTDGAETTVEFSVGPDAGGRS